MHSSSSDINLFLHILSAKRAVKTDGAESLNGFFDRTDTMYQAIDDINFDFENIEWKTIKIRYTGPIGPDAHWMHEVYELHYRDIDQATVNMAHNTEFDGSWDYAPFEEYPCENNRRYSSLMSAQFAWKQAVSTQSLSQRLPVLLPSSNTVWFAVSDQYTNDSDAAKNQVPMNHPNIIFGASPRAFTVFNMA